MNGFVLDGVENITGPREKAGNHHFLRFPQCFQKSRENMGFYGTGSSFEAQNRYDSTNMYFFLFHFVFNQSIKQSLTEINNRVAAETISQQSCRSLL